MARLRRTRLLSWRGSNDSETLPPGSCTVAMVVVEVDMDIVECIKAPKRVSRNNAIGKHVEFEESPRQAPFSFLRCAAELKSRHVLAREPRSLLPRLKTTRSPLSGQNCPICGAACSAAAT